MMNVYEYESPLGTLILTSDDGEALTALYNKNQKYFPASLPEVDPKNVLLIFKETSKWLDVYFTGKNPDFTPKLAPKGTLFREKVWKILCEIPFGKVITYGEISKRLAKEMDLSTMSSQAVGGAVGHNPISIIIPCHRVVGAGGNLTGYAGGLPKKIKLLEIEGLDMNKFYLPKEKSSSKELSKKLF